MIHSYLQVWLHIVWRTHDSERLLYNEKAIQIRQHIIDYAQKSNIHIESINVQPEHIHTLINFPSDKMIKDVVKTLKGESSHYINANNLCPKAFSWARGYGAFSLGHSQLDTVKNYISNQSEHHKRRSFTEEWNIILKRYGLQDENR
ncbi:MAG: IS200/IS605 family transposase [Candidatus Cloacimonetes bacterium]|nr:IS200/IS605 family transposase [Candidatus Cloacimonadota bacterium]